METVEKSPLTKSGSASVGSKHLQWLDAVRCFAALWVVAHHAFLTVSFVPQNKIERILRGFLQNGHMAVVLFIALSGYSLTLQTRANGWNLKAGYKEFIISRMVRIVPPYYAAILGSLALIALLIGKKTGTHWDVSIPVPRTAILSHFLMIQNLYGSPYINHAFWSVSLEFQIYVFFGLILAGLRRASLVGSMAIAVLLAGASFALFRSLNSIFPGQFADAKNSLAPFFVVFAMGCASCRVSVDYPAFGSKYGKVLLLTSLFIGATATSFGPWKDIVFGLAAAMGLYAFSSNADLQHLSVFRGFAAIGGFAYSIYLVHAPLLQCVYVLVGLWWPVTTIFKSLEFYAVSIPTCVLAGYGFYLAIEKPCFRLRHFLNRQQLLQAGK